MNIFVGNLSFEAGEEDLKKLFEGFGNVASVAIVTRKEKKAPKSRGFGFVEIQDEQQALAALAALNGREFMGRVLDISPARPNPTRIALPIPFKEGAKTEAQPFSSHLALIAPRPNGRAGTPPSAVDGRVIPSGRPGIYSGGRRTRSYMKRQGLAGMQEEAKPRRKNYDNPMRWRKKGEQPRPWEKSPGEHKPRKEAEEGVRPWKKSTEKPKSWKKPAAEAKPGSKSSARPQKSRFKIRGVFRR